MKKEANSEREYHCKPLKVSRNEITNILRQQYRGFARQPYCMAGQ